MKTKKKSASRRRGEILPIDSYSLMGDPNRFFGPQQVESEDRRSIRPTTTVAAGSEQ
jgi:hypothetical protein